MASPPPPPPPPPAPQGVLAAIPGAITTAVHDQLEHSNWAARKAYGWAASIGLVLLIAIAIALKVESAIPWLCGTWGFLMFLIIVTPSGEQCVKIIQTVAALKAGVVFSSSSSATAPSGAIAESSTTAGTPAAPASTKVAPE